jgi:excisionase family DNA binding protein
MDAHGNGSEEPVSDPVDDLAAAAHAFALAILAARPVDEERNYSITEAAERLGISRAMVYNRIKRGEISSLKIGTRRLIPASEVRRINAAAEPRSPTIPARR